MQTLVKKILLTTAALTAAPVLLLAQPTAHYVPGVEGIKGASLPPPGFYLRDYNVCYFADRLNDNHGDEIKPADPSAFIYANVPRLLWITEEKLLGGSVGVDALLPLQYTSLKANTPGGPFDDSTFGIGDFFVEGTLSWHKPQADYSLAYGLWMPTDDSSVSNPTRAGLGYFTHMLTAGATWYPDKDKQWSISLLNRYEFNHEKADTSITPGQAWTLEWGAGYSLSKKTDVGVVGYFQYQTTRDSGSGASNEKDQVIAIGPEVSTVCPLTGMLVSLRYLREVSAENRLQGNTVALTLTKRF
ncbi:MAG: hypothetical protein RLY20_1705 [Verrucomicrobiota bacterium]|jgi:hypothetical protein